MESKYNINEIITQVGDIGELISQMHTDGPVPLIEIDIVMDKIRRLYADVSGLKKNSLSDKPKVVSTKEKAVKEVEKKVPQAMNETQTMNEAKASEEQSEPEDFKLKTEEPATLADKFKGGKKFINESLGENGTRQDLSTKLQSKPIQDIGTALGLNDRFKLINELFNGDKESYQQTISILDNASNFNEAFNYISTSYDWDMEDDSVQMLLDLVRRKFIVNKNE